MDYMISPLFNCFSGDTEIITDRGVKTFRKLGENRIVNVLTKDGEFSPAIVKKYGKQKLNTVTMTSGRTTRKVRVTANHRWVLKDGSITTNLQVGDRLVTTKPIGKSEVDNFYKVLGFVLGDGSDIERGKDNGVRVRLCGDKIELLQLFLDEGFNISQYKYQNPKDVLLYNNDFPSKWNFIDNKVWEYLNKKQLQSLFEGYYLADGSKDRNQITTSNPNLAQMIREISAISGYHITSENIIDKPTNFSSNRLLYVFNFMTSQPSNRNWVIKAIDTENLNLNDVWCVEEPKTNTFTLNGGIVTGNCCLVNLEDMLYNGTVINGKMIDRPKSFQVACTVTTQIIAQIASNQFGLI